MADNGNIGRAINVIRDAFLGARVVYHRCYPFNTPAKRGIAQCCVAGRISGICRDHPLYINYYHVAYEKASEEMKSRYGDFTEGEEADAETEAFFNAHPAFEDEIVACDAVVVVVAVTDGITHGGAENADVDTQASINQPEEQPEEQPEGIDDVGCHEISSSNTFDGAVGYGSDGAEDQGSEGAIDSVCIPPVDGTDAPEIIDLLAI